MLDGEVVLLAQSKQRRLLVRRGVVIGGPAELRDSGRGSGYLDGLKVADNRRLRLHPVEPLEAAGDEKVDVDLLRLELVVAVGEGTAAAKGTLLSPLEELAGLRLEFGRLHFSVASGSAHGGVDER